MSSPKQYCFIRFNESDPYFSPSCIKISFRLASVSSTPSLSASEYAMSDATCLISILASTLSFSGLLAIMNCSREPANTGEEEIKANTATNFTNLVIRISSISRDKSSRHSTTSALLINGFCNLVDALWIGIQLDCTVMV